MQIRREAIAGTLESSDVLIKMEPSGHPLEVILSSPVKAQYGASIEAQVRQWLNEAGVSVGRVELEDKGALDCTIMARLKTCLERASEPEKAEGGQA